MFFMVIVPLVLVGFLAIEAGPTCDTRPPLIVIDANNKTILTDSIQAAYNTWTLSQKSGFNSYFVQIKNVIYSNVPPTVDGKINSLITIFQSYNSNNKTLQALLWKVNIIGWGGNITDFIYCQNATTQAPTTPTTTLPTTTLSTLLTTPSTPSVTTPSVPPSGPTASTPSGSGSSPSGPTSVSPPSSPSGPTSVSPPSSPSVPTTVSPPSSPSGPTTVGGSTVVITLPTAPPTGGSSPVTPPSTPAESTVVITLPTSSPSSVSTVTGSSTSPSSSSPPTTARPACVDLADTASLTFNATETGVSKETEKGSCPCESANKKYFYETVNSDPSSSIPAATFQCTSMSDFCMCTEDGECFTQLGTSLEKVEFFPYCEGMNCHMYAVVYDDFGGDGSGLQGDQSHQLHSVDQTDGTDFLAMGAGSPYLKAKSAGCGGCDLIRSDTCFQA